MVRADDEKQPAVTIDTWKRILLVGQISSRL